MITFNSRPTRVGLEGASERPFRQRTLCRAVRNFTQKRNAVDNMASSEKMATIHYQKTKAHLNKNDSSATVDTDHRTLEDGIISLHLLNGLPRLLELDSTDRHLDLWYQAEAASTLSRYPQRIYGGYMRSGRMVLTGP